MSRLDPFSFSSQAEAPTPNTNKTREISAQRGRGATVSARPPRQCGGSEMVCHLTNLRRAAKGGEEKVNAFQLGVRRILARIACAGLAAVLVAGAAYGAGSTGPLVVGIVAPFTGADAQLGPAYFSSCLPATRIINNS